MAEPGRVLNPVEVEAAIRNAVETVTQGVDEVTVRLQTYRDAERVFEVAEATAYMRATGPVEERKRKALLATQMEREAMEVAEVAYKYAERRTRAAENTLSAYQTISKSVTAMYGAAGRGEY
ncbi:hypothetical protein QC999_gp58 [Microbacterium phage Cressida]|uniref:Uncharacterized protein n=1 Tax=Microbacterium phage Cressida TaxID=2591216 RepID=A0A514DI50_9CAUD|nr:hypothetical protein QC999_gp58 [Microbacterium phage Cressida]QDH93292.1 hypothetical protein PBI_CRESSIDA_50 [Microbacterium phage Cressida]